MSSRTPEWHAEAKQLLSEGFTVTAIARKLGRHESTVRWAVNAPSARRRAEWRSERSIKVEPERASRSNFDPAVKPTLPNISMPDLDGPNPPRVLRFAPRTRLTGSAGAERIREIHRRMIREGRVREPEPGLPELLSH